MMSLMTIYNLFSNLTNTKIVKYGNFGSFQKKLYYRNVEKTNVTCRSSIRQTPLHWKYIIWREMFEDYLSSTLTSSNQPALSVCFWLFLMKDGQFENLPSPKSLWFVAAKGLFYTCWNVAIVVKLVRESLSCERDYDHYDVRLPDDKFHVNSDV